MSGIGGWSEGCQSGGSKRSCVWAVEKTAVLLGTWRGWSSGFTGSVVAGLMQNAQYGVDWLGLSASAMKATMSRKKTNSNETGMGHADNVMGQRVWTKM